MNKEQSRTRKVFASMVVLGLVAGLATIASFAAFSSTTSNGTNDFDAGTVYITDNDDDAVMYDVSNQKPGVPTESCIVVTYAGTLPSTVKFYGSRTSTQTLDQYVNVKVEEGTQATPAFGDCTGFTPTTELFNDTLDTFMTDHSSFSDGLTTTDSNGGNWATTDTRVYRFTVTVADDNNANGQGAGPLSTGDHSFTWEAQNI
jgi:hypothetical protein